MLKTPNPKTYRKCNIKSNDFIHNPIRQLVTV